MSAAKNKTFYMYVIPSVLAFTLSGIYAIVDGFFIGHSLGDTGLAAITLGYPVTAFIQAIGTGIGLSGAIRFTIMKAQGEQRKQQECFSGTILLMVLAGIILTALLFGLVNPILQVLGADGKSLMFSVEYVRIIALGAIFQLLATGFVPFIRNMGGASFAMITMILGFITNIILDYIFVWIADWGMTGAALATIIGQSATMIAAILFFVMKKSKLYAPNISKLFGLWKDVLKVAISPFGLTFSPILTMLFMNRFLMFYGNEQSVTVYGCIAYVTSIIYLLLQGVGDGCQPLISNYYGENNIAVMKHTRKLAYVTAAVITTVCIVGVYIARAKVGVLFGASANSNVDVVKYLPYFLVTLLPLAFVRVTTSYFYATEKTILSYVLVYAEPVCALLFLLLLPLIFKLMGVWLAIPLAQVFAFVIAWIAKYCTDGRTLKEA